MFSLLMFQKKHIQNQTTSYHLYYHPPSPGHHHLCFNCCVTSSHCLAPIPTPASLPQPQGLWDPLSPTNFWIELLFTQQASLYAFVLCENDSQRGMSGGHFDSLPATPKSPLTRRGPPRGTPSVPAPLPLSPFSPPDRDKIGRAHV